MDTLVNQLARELADAIAAAIADDTRVESCREKARAASSTEPEVLTTESALSLKAVAIAATGAPSP